MGYILATVVFATVVTCVFAAAIKRSDRVECPPSALIEPCTCNALKKSISCYSVRWFNLREIFLNMAIIMNGKNKRFNLFRLHGDYDSPLPITELEENTFGEFSFESIVLRNTQIEKMHSNAFDSTYNVTKRVIWVSNKISNSKEKGEEYAIYDILSKFSHLTHIDLHENSLESIPSRAFRPLNGHQFKLYFIRLEFNQIKYIGDQAFRYLPLLSFLVLNSNQINRIEKHAFQFFETQDTIEIKLEHNQLEDNSFIEGSMDRTNRPVALFLDHNRITQLSETIFRSFLTRDAVTYIDINNNVLTCACNARWLLELKNTTLPSRVKHMWCPNGVYFWDKTLSDLERCSWSIVIGT